MFRPRECFKGAVLVFVMSALWFRSVYAGLVMAAIPLIFGVLGMTRI